MNKTIVAFIEKQVVATISEERKALLERVVPKANILKIVETDDTYVIVRLADERVAVILDNTKGEEELNAKLTLTGLMPHEHFDVYAEDAVPVEYRLANQAGILEYMYRVEEKKSVLLISTME